jgi:hypothetical protein
MAVRIALAREQDTRTKRLSGDDPVFIEAVTRAHLWEASLKDYLTGAHLGAEEFGKADPRVTDAIQVQAFVLYVAWASEAYPGPKGSSGTEPQTPTSESPELPTTSDAS